MDINPNLKKFDSLFQSKYPNLEFEIKSSATFDFLNFPASKGSDYNFLMCFYDDTDFSILATVTPQPELFEDTPFWEMRFNSEDIFNSDVEMFDEVMKNLMIVLQNPTRIIQRRKLFRWVFTCDYQKDSRWIKLYSYSLMWSTQSVPAISGKEKVYYSKPKLLSNAG